jgi:hypothetical protein
MFCDMPSCGPLKMNQAFCLLPAACFMLVSFLPYSSTLKTEACSNEPLVNFQRATRCYIQTMELSVTTAQFDHYYLLSTMYPICVSSEREIKRRNNGKGVYATDPA